MTDSISNYYDCLGNVDATSWAGNEGDENIRLRLTEVSQNAGLPYLDTAHPLKVIAEITIARPVNGLIFGFRLFSAYGADLAYSLYDDAEHPPATVVEPGTLRKTWTIPAHSLAAGHYKIGFAVGIHNQKAIVLNTSGTLSFKLENISGMGRRFTDYGKGTDSMFRPNWIVE